MQADKHQTHDVVVKLTSTDDPYAIALCARQRDEILLTDPALGPFADNIPDFIVLVRNGKAIACGGFRVIQGEDSHIGEIKRVYVVPEARGRAVGTADFLMRELESRAISKGFRTLRLQTSKNMLAANRFYERHGYRLVQNYGDYVECTFTISYEKVVG
ncbi:acyl-CoA N-acyltransferase [Myriangium duriaei CBS 260.36]|uniref:Acyl-CoA N-acyltransferase n=1 Tax=Myriangium duriaei CBS 260.36 TaxID=1168546 RepID=A0A9P4MIP1_9PEZI|nr:acyl-CoA N-acyltransferase [Myriangium duriaei CBS 260.36]